MKVKNLGVGWEVKGGGKIAGLTVDVIVTFDEL